MGKNVILAGLVAMLAAAPASAVVVAGTLTGGTALQPVAATRNRPAIAAGTFVIVDPIPSGFAVGDNNFQDHNVRAFNEAQKFKLTSDLRFNGSPNVAAGVRVSSHYVVFDPRETRTAIGSITFGNRILGVMTNSTRLAESDFLGNPLVSYLNPNARGLEANTDSVVFSGKALNYTLQAGSPGDSFRVITAVPEPANWAMLIAGFGLVGAAQRRRRNARVFAA